VNRIDRLYALAEELRAAAPRPLPARRLAERFEVSTRTIERDLSALQQAGVPVYATPGPGGGYAVDPAHTLPPVNFTAEEATALAIALARPGRSPLAGALRSALRKVVAAMPPGGAEGARRLAGKVRLFPEATDVEPPTARVVEQAVAGSVVVAIGYRDRFGEVTERDVEPAALVGSADAWYLVGHCRLRDGARVFRLDRIATARLTGEPADPPPDTLAKVPTDLRTLSLLE
jgi:predicted DNA-binding transcriptional regulator YafY